MTGAVPLGLLLMGALVWRPACKVSIKPGETQTFPGQARFSPKIFAPDAVGSLTEFLGDAMRRVDPLPTERLTQTRGVAGTETERRVGPTPPAR